MSHPVPTHERDNEYPEDELAVFNKMTPAEHFQKIMDITELLKVQVADLQDYLNDYKRL